MNSDSILNENCNALFDTVFDAVFISKEGGAKDKIIEVNKSAIELTGYSRSELLKSSITKIIIDEAFNSKSLIKKDGTLIPCDVRVKKLDSGKKTILYVVKDQTETEKLKKENSVKKDILLQQSKMATMGEMIGVIAHQWKQPINIISLLIQQVGEIYKKLDGKDAKTLEEMEARVLEQTQYMSQTITDFKEFFKPSKEKTSFDPYVAAMEVTNLIKAKLDKDSLTINIKKGDKLLIDGYENEFKQVIVNIFNNAREKINELGTKNGYINMTFEKEGYHAKILIEDNGGGIDKAMLPSKLFEPYETTKGSNGTGIGLTICKTIIEDSMGGRITAQNHENGALFILKIPLSAREIFNSNANQ